MSCSRFSVARVALRRDSCLLIVEVVVVVVLVMVLWLVVAEMDCVNELRLGVCTLWRLLRKLLPSLWGP